MNTSFLGLRTSIVHVKDLDKAKIWYTEVFGVAPYFDEPFYVGFSVSGYEFGLDPNMNNIINGTNAEVYWGVNDVEAVYQRLLSLGATTHHAPQEVGGDIIVASVLDPFGNVFGIIYNPHFTLEKK